MELTNISNNPISDLTVQNGLTPSQNDLSINDTQKISDSFSNSYFVNPDLSSKRSNLSNNLSQHITAIASSQVELSKLTNQNNILDNIIQTSNEVLTTNTKIEPKIEHSLNDLMNKYQTVISTDVISENENTDSTSYFDGMIGAKPLKLQDMVKVSTELKQSTQNEIKVVEQKIQTVKEIAINTIGEEVSKNASLQPNKQIDFGKTTSDFSASNINSLVGSVALTQANAIPVSSQRLLS